MARKQSDYLAALLADESGASDMDVNHAGTPRPVERPRATTLIDREAVLARVAGGQVRQVTQLLLDPARVRIWPGNPRAHDLLSEASCRELIDSMIAEGGQKVPAVVRRVEDDPDHDYEVVVGTRRHWSVAWLRAHSYPDIRFVAQVAQLDDEAAFRLADLENRARTDVSDFERACNYLAALRTHYGNHQTRMAERLRVSKSWLSKMLKVAMLPDAVVAAFASPADIQLKSGYQLAQLIDDPTTAQLVAAAAKGLAREQADARNGAGPSLPSAEVMRRLVEAATPRAARFEPYHHINVHGRAIMSVQSVNRQGMTIRLHAGSGADADDLAEALRITLGQMEAAGQGLRR